MRLTGLLGLVVILAAAYLFSTARKVINTRIIAYGIGLQFFFAVLVLKFSLGQRVNQRAVNVVNRLLRFAKDGSTFVFGSLADPSAPAGFVFAFRVLPTIIFMT